MSNRQDIETTVNQYVQGYLEARPEALAAAFHPGALLLSTDANAVETTLFQGFLASVEARALKNERRQADAQLQILDETPDSAAVRVTLTFPTFRFVDHLSLLRLPAGWKIVSKTYVREERS